MLRLAVMMCLAAGLFGSCISEPAPLLIDTPPGYVALMARQS